MPLLALLRTLNGAFQLSDDMAIPESVSNFTPINLIAILIPVVTILLR
jgi:hypothetical protein